MQTQAAQAAIHKLEAEIMSTNEDGIAGLQLVDFWLNICVCHSLLVETAPDGSVLYQGPSPDEVALVEAARQLGFVFKHRDVNSVFLDFQVRSTHLSTPCYEEI
jgi:magnesium-transporting ATPase (P-type)